MTFQAPILMPSRYMADLQEIWDDWVSLNFEYNRIFSDASLDSVSRSPLYSIYGETISGVTIIRAFGASSKFLRDMLRCVDTVCYLFLGAINWHVQLFRRMLTLTTGCGEVMICQFILFENLVDFLSFFSESLALNSLQSTLCCYRWGNWFTLSRYFQHQCLCCGVCTYICLHAFLGSFILRTFQVMIAVEPFITLTF